MRLPRKRHPYPYYKVQTRDPKSLAWRDHRREVFDTLAEARSFRAALPSTVETRIMCWTERGSSPVDDAS